MMVLTGRSTVSVHGAPSVTNLEVVQILAANVTPTQTTVVDLSQLVTVLNRINFQFLSAQYTYIVLGDPVCA